MKEKAEIGAHHLEMLKIDHRKRHIILGLGDKMKKAEQRGPKKSFKAIVRAIMLFLRIYKRIRHCFVEFDNQQHSMNGRLTKFYHKIIAESVQDVCYKPLHRIKQTPNLLNAHEKDKKRICLKIKVLVEGIFKNLRKAIGD